MRASAPARLGLATVGIATALAAGREDVALAMPVIASGFVMAGEIRLLTRLAIGLVPVVLFSGLLWLFVGRVDLVEPSAAAAALVAPGAPFLSLIRPLTGSCAIVLALGTVPDGEGVAVMRSLGLPLGAAVIVASGLGLAAGISEGFSRSVVVLRAHGIVGPGRWSRVRHLGAIVALTWTAALSETVARTEGKWVANGFLATLDPDSPGGDVGYLWGSLVLFATAAALAAILLGGAR